MFERSTETMVTFRRAFQLSALDGAQPAGTYRLVVEEEQILGLSFVAYQRVATSLHIPAVNGAYQVFQIDHVELEAALEADSRGV